MKKTTQQKLTFQKKSFRVVDGRELARIKGGNGEMVLDGGGLVAEIPGSGQQ